MSNATVVSTKYKLYQYEPSLPGGIVVAVIFAGLTIAHYWKLWRHKTKYFVPFIIGGVFQVIGYGTRAGSHFDQYSIPAFATQSLLILLAPALYAASIYMILSRLIRRLQLEAASIVSPRWLTRIFVCGDVVSFVVQLGGGGLQAVGKANLLSTGRNIIIVGLAIQIVFFSVFIITAVITHRRALALGVRRADIPWQRHLKVLYTVNTLILVRSIFRIIEYGEGNDGYLISHEIFLYIFDALLMVLVMAILLVWYVGDLQVDGRPQSVGSKEIPLTSV